MFKNINNYTQEYSNFEDLENNILSTNGRIDLLTEEDDIKEGIANTLQVNNGYTDALTGNQINTPLSMAFFCKENIQILQNGIRAGVYKVSNGMYNVGYQDETTLKIIMRNIFLEYAIHQKNNETNEIRELNKRVLDYSIRTVFNEAASYVKFKNDVSVLSVPNDRPESVNLKGRNPLELKKFL